MVFDIYIYILTIIIREHTIKIVFDNITVKINILCL